MPERIVRYLPERMRPFVERNLHLIGYLILFAAFVVSVVGSTYAVTQASKKAARAEANAVRKAGRVAFRRIEESRVEATREACRQRNIDRRSSRRIINRQLEQVKNAPEGAFEQFGVTREKALSDLRGDRAAIPKIDCAEAVREIRRTSPTFPAGDGKREK